MKSNRRYFMKASVAATGALVLSSMLKPFELLLMASDPPPEKGPWWGIGIDISKCIGCGLCARGCKIENSVPEEPFYFRTWVEQYTILHNGELKIESPNGGIDGFEQSVPEEDIFKTFFVPKMCSVTKGNHSLKLIVLEFSDLALLVSLFMVPFLIIITTSVR